MTRESGSREQEPVDKRPFEGRFMPRRVFLERTGGLLLAGSGLGSLLTACGGGDDAAGTEANGTTGADSESGEGRVIGFEHPNNHIPLWAVIMHWSEIAANERGVELRIPADEGKLGRQVATLNTWITQGLDAILCFPLDTETINGLAAKAQAKGIKWVTYAGTIPNQDGEVQLNNVKSGELLGEAAGRFVNDKHGGKAKALHLTFPDGGQFGRERDKGVVDAFTKTAPDAEIVASEKAIDEKSGLRVATAVLNAHRDLKVVLGVNDDGALGAMRAFQERGHDENDPDIWIGGQDGAKQALELVKKGTMYRATVAISMKDLGDVCVGHTTDIATGAAADPIANVPVHLATGDDGELIDRLLSELDY